MEGAYAFRHATDESRDRAFAVRQGKRFEKLHDDVGPSVVGTLAVTTGEMRRRVRFEETHLAAEAVNVLWFGTVQDLQRGRDAGLAIPDAVHFGRSAAPDEPGDTPFADFRSVGERRLRDDIAVAREEIAKGVVVIVNLHRHPSNCRRAHAGGPASAFSSGPPRRD